MQRTQPAAKFPEALHKYGSDQHTFDINGNSLEYLMDGVDVSEINWDDRKNNRVGYFDLPCGRVVLYLDEHVEVLGRGGKPLASP